MSLTQLTAKSLIDEHGETVASFDKDGWLWIDGENPWSHEDTAALRDFLNANTNHTITPGGGGEE